MKLSRVNNGLFIAIIAINLFVICMPLIPMISLWIRQQTGTSIQLEAKLGNANNQSNANRLIIPSILLDEEILEGSDASTLNNGLWRRPHTATPSEVSNTVITGHRFTYTDPIGAFYHLDKLNIGDEIGVLWEGQTLLYRVTDKFVAPADAVHVEDPTTTNRLTLYTCTPLWNPVDRLVVVAEPQQSNTGVSHE